MSFNNFDILSQYFPKESNELKDKNKFPLLVLDNYYLPFFTDWVEISINFLLFLFFFYLFPSFDLIFLIIFLGNT